jgi:excisionase family DNA binding protein
MERLLSIGMVAEHLGVSPWTIRVWIKQGKLGSAKLGTRRLVPQSEVMRFLASSFTPATSPATARVS